MNKATVEKNTVTQQMRALDAAALTRRDGPSTVKTDSVKTEIRSADHKTRGA
jgi:hypothetical protein